MITDQDLRRYLKDRHAFRREQLVLPNGKLYGDAEEVWQAKHVWKPLDELDGHGQPLRHLVYLELARGHAKTTMAAMEALTSGLLDDRMEIYLFAGDAEQAAIALDILAGMVRANPDLDSAFQIQKDRILVPSTGTRIQVMSSDAPTAFGIGGMAKGLLVICDELWVWRNPMLWEAVISSTGKVGANWRVLVLSNAGIYEDSKVAWSVREACRMSEDPSFLLLAL